MTLVKNRGKCRCSVALLLSEEMLLNSLI